MIDSVLNEYTLVLSKRNHDKIGQLSNGSAIVSKVNFNAANEISFTVYKYIDKDKYINSAKEDKHKYIMPLWDELTDFKYVWVKELNEYYEIKVDINDEESEYKTVTGTSACEAELSQTNIYNFEVNTEADIAREDYDSPTVFYSPDNPRSSLLHRALYKNPNYHIKYVDRSLWYLQRTFSADGVDVYSFLTDTVAKEIECLFTFDSTDRSISVYDLKVVCLDCGHRGDDIMSCQECGSSNLKYYGEDTTVFIDKENIAKSITLTTDTDSIKNCFRLEAGDDDMTAAVINCNPNGSQYIYYFSDELKHDMSDELVEKINSYDNLYSEYQEEYSNVMEDVYEAIDKIVYYTSSMMPSEKIVEQLPSNPLEGVFYLLKVQGKTNIYDEYIWRGSWIKLEQVERFEETSARIEMGRIINAINSVGLNSFMSLAKITPSTSSATVSSALKQYAKVFFNSGLYKIDVSGDFSYYGISVENETEYNFGYWTGSITLTGFSNDEDKYTETNVRFKVDNNYYYFLNEKVQKQIAQHSDDEGSVYDVLSIKVMKSDGKTEDYDATLTKFKHALKYYSLNRLTSFSDAIQGVIDVMIEENIGSSMSDLYNTFYEPYYNKLIAVQDEINIRSNDISYWEALLEERQNRQFEIQDILNFERYIGKDLYNEFLSFRREDVYKNDNYISDGLENNEIFENARKFIDVAKEEIVKSGEGQHSISADLNNLLKIKEFEPIKDKFKLGNWIRVGIDKKIYRLRLIGYETNSENPEELSVEFSDVTKSSSSINEIGEILNKASSMATSYSSVMRQVNKDAKTTDKIKDWVNNGIDITNNKIVSNANYQNFTIGEKGFLGKRYDNISEEYYDEQIKLINNGLYTTKDNWKTIESAIGTIAYIDPDTGEEVIDYGVIAKKIIGKLILGEELGIYSNNNSSEMKFDDRGLILNAKRDENGEYGSIFQIQKDGKPVMMIDGNGNIQIDMYAKSEEVHAIQGSVNKTVAGIEMHYLATNLGEGVTVETPGWTDTVQEISKDKKYLWTYRTLVTVGGDRTNTSPVITGTWGEDGVVGQHALTVKIDSTKGTIFRNEDSVTELICSVYYGVEDVTNKVSSFRWFKYDQDGNLDESWNRNTQGNRITLSTADVYNRAQFGCEVEIDL